MKYIKVKKHKRTITRGLNHIGGKENELQM